MLPSPNRPASHSAERSSGPLWLWPCVGGAVAAVLASLLSVVRPEDGLLARLWPADASAAGTLLQLVATAAVTATTLIFSITVVALQLASQQFSPRLLRSFVRDPVTKVVLLVLTSAFSYSLAGLRAVHQDRPVPTLMVLVAALLGLATLAAVLAFTTHMVRTLRVDTMMLRVHDETSTAMEQFYPPYGDPSVRSPSELDLDAARGCRVAADGSGYVRVVETAEGVAAARDRGLVLRLEVRPGDHVVRGAPIATAWDDRGGPAEPETAAEVVGRIVQLDYERTLDQDAAFGLRQLEDIAVKAMSPGINDPVTATAAVGHMTDLLVRLPGFRLGATLHVDEDGVGRLVVPDRDLRYYLTLACGQLRRFGAGEPTVLGALLRMLREVGRACRDDDQRAEVAYAADLVVEGMSSDLIDADAAAVLDMRRRVTLALEGRIEEAYADRAGETRSV